MCRSRQRLLKPSKTGDARTKSTRLRRAWSVAKPLAPEEIRLGDRVIVLHQIVEMPSFFWEVDSTTLPVDRVVRVTRIPDQVEPPLKVTTVCLPMVGTETWNGETRLFDVRLIHLARVDRAFAKTIWKGLRKSTETNTTASL